MKKPIIVVWIAAMLLVLSAGCTAQPEPTAPQSRGGTLYITVNPEIAVTYDADGTVISVTAVTEDAKDFVDTYRDYVGKECTQVVTELVTKIGQAGYLSEDSADVVISISFEKESGVPDESFVQEMEQQVQAVVADNDWQGTVTVAEPEPAVQPTVPPPTDAPSGPAPTPSGEAPTDPPPTTESDPTVEPTAEPTVGPTLPGNLPESEPGLESGPQVVTDYTDLQGNTVPGEEECYYIRTTTFNEAGNPASQELITKETGAVAARATWAYDSRNVCVSYEYVRFFSTGAVREHYRETYDSAGQCIQRTSYDDTGAVAADIFYSYNDNGNQIREEERNADGITVSRKEYSEGGILLSSAAFFDDGTQKSLVTYYENGVTATQTTWQEDGTMRIYEEFYENGTTKGFTRWRADGSKEADFTSFHEDAIANGIHQEYDASGNLTMRDVMGNPDGSPNKSEYWDADGTYRWNTFRDDYLLQAGYVEADGSTVTETYDYDAGTIHVETSRPNSIGDTVTSMDTGEILSGYIESTLENGNYHYVEYANGNKYKEILDGQVNPLGYTYRQTTVYYANGQPQRSEQYYYADGGHLYAEYDESGNVIYSEDTTEYNYGVFE